MLILPHLPAPTAVHNPSNGNEARVARTATPRIPAHEPVDAYRNSRLRRDLSRSETGEPVERRDDEAAPKARPYRETSEIFEPGTTNLFFAQRFAQEENPANHPSVAHEIGAAAYPSLTFDDDILLPGEAVPLGWLDRPRLDIVV